MRFEKFVADNEAKRSRALEKYEAAQEENASKQSQIEELTEELRHLRVRWGCDSSSLSLKLQLGLKLTFDFTGSKF